MRNLMRTCTAIVLCFGAICADAVGLESNCFKLTQGGKYPTLVYTNNSDVAFEVRSWGSNAWWVVTTSTRGTCYVAAATVGEEVLDAPFENHNTGIDSGLEDVFRFQFRWTYQEDGKYAVYDYGWVSLVTNSVGDVSILASQVADVHGLAVVGQGEPEPVDLGELPASVTFKADFYGEGENRYAVLAQNCIDKSTCGWVVIPNTIDDAPVAGIGDSAFAACVNLTRINIPSSIRDIGESAFAGCSSLTSCEIPSSVTNIGGQAFFNCGFLQLTVGGNIACIQKATCRSCLALTNVVLTEGVEIVSSDAFAKCGKLTSVTIPWSLKRIESGAFADTAITAVTLPFFVDVADDAFPNGCTITRTPELMILGSAKKVDAATQSAFYRTLIPLAEQCKDREALEVEADHFLEEPSSASFACAHLGISPSRYDRQEESQYVNFYYRMPTVNILGIDFDETAHTLTAQVIPAEGSKIVAAPLVRAFGFSQLVFDTETYWGDDYGSWFLYDSHEGFIADFNDYVTSNGVFRLTFPNWCAELKDPQPAHIFKIILHDNKYHLW